MLGFSAAFIFGPCFLLPPSSSSSSSSSSFTSLQVEPTGLGLHPATGLSSGRVVSGTETKVNKS